MWRRTGRSATLLKQIFVKQVALLTNLCKPGSSFIILLVSKWRTHLEQIFVQLWSSEVSCLEAFIVWTDTSCIPLLYWMVRVTICYNPDSFKTFMVQTYMEVPVLRLHVEHTWKKKLPTSQVVLCLKAFIVRTDGHHCGCSASNECIDAMLGADKCTSGASTLCIPVIVTIATSSQSANHEALSNEILLESNPRNFSASIFYRSECKRSPGDQIYHAFRCASYERMSRSLMHSAILEHK